MDPVRFTWNSLKAKYNLRKHKIAFEEAKTVFQDSNALLIEDPDHSQDEERFVLMGFSTMLKLLVVVHCYREQDTLIRIISARRATKTEASEYWKNL